MIETNKQEIGDDIRRSATAIALIEAGIDQFGLYGQKATTRNVAEHANANIAAIPYYFRSKNGLYNACMHYIVDEIWAQIGDQLSNASQNIEDLNQAQASQRYLAIMEAFCQFFLQDPDTLRWSQFVMREHATPTQAYEIFYQRYYQHAQSLKVKLLSVCLGKYYDEKRLKVISHALFGQALGFLLARESLLRGLGIEELSTDDVKLISDVVTQNVRSVLVNPTL
ncbi:CerR family C-terminal domain-containing protein [Ningiella sp. W23]|uniref:CerR family C-terminal domain-containing protein n=1 Tax=Ningiella sp. W23 TaxID=3023715 RepID=UPI0039F59204